MDCQRMTALRGAPNEMIATEVIWLGNRKCQETHTRNAIAIEARPELLTTWGGLRLLAIARHSRPHAVAREHHNQHREEVADDGSGNGYEGREPCDDADDRAHVRLDERDGSEGDER